MSRRSSDPLPTKWCSSTKAPSRGGASEQYLGQTRGRVDLDSQLRLHERLHDQQRVRRVLAVREVLAEILLAGRVKASDVIRVDQVFESSGSRPPRQHRSRLPTSSGQQSSTLQPARRSTAATTASSKTRTSGTYATSTTSHSFDDELLLATETALRALAQAAPERCERLIEDGWTTENEAVCALLFEAFAGNPERFADKAIDFLVSDTRRLRVGWSDDDHWATRRLLGAVTPHCSDAALERLETVLLAYYTSWERSAPGRSEFGCAQFALLGGIAEARRSPAVRKRFAEHQRKLGRDDAPGPEGIIGSFVGSPLPASAAEHMTDEQWRAAIASYNSDRFEARRDFLKGGAIELSRDLQQRVTEEPERFARFALTLLDETHVAYFEAVLDGVGRSVDGVSLELAHELSCAVTRCRTDPAGATSPTHSATTPPRRSLNPRSTSSVGMQPMTAIPRGTAGSLTRTLLATVCISTDSTRFAAVSPTRSPASSTPSRQLRTPARRDRVARERSSHRRARDGGRDCARTPFATTPPRPGRSSCS